MELLEILPIQASAAHCRKCALHLMASRNVLPVFMMITNTCK